MRGWKLQFARWCARCIVTLALIAPGVSWAQADSVSYELCIEHSPASAGTVTPNVGTHRFGANAVVTVSAEAQPGYRFACWIGDVRDPKAKRTTVYLNSPKVVVAVFQPTSDDAPPERLSFGGGGGGSSALSRSLVDLSAPSISPGGAPKVEKSKTPTIVVVPTPEPSTVLLLGLGAVVLRRRRPRRS
jgi:hypothetical protein